MVLSKSLWALALSCLIGSTNCLTIPNIPTTNELTRRTNDDACGQNEPGNRECWYDNYDIDSNYEEETPEGELKEFTLHIQQGKWAGDGYPIDAMLINGQYPGPPIIANWGDTIKVTVVNDLQNENGTSIHWHGIRQLGSFDQDGVPGVTQCPIPPGASMTYVFKATQYGTSWYHSHFGLQYADGVVGPLIINGPSTGDYEEDLGALTVTDWYHQSAFALFGPTELVKGRPPTVDSRLLNGKWGSYTCKENETECQQAPKNWFKQKLQKGKTYKWRIINTSAATHWKIWFEGHSFNVTATDFVPIVPFKTDSLFVAIGQRYDIVFKADADTTVDEAFWINMRDCSQSSKDSRMGVMTYSDDPASMPKSKTSVEHDQAKCTLENPANLVPKLPWRNIPPPPQNSPRNTPLLVGHTRNLTTSPGRPHGYKPTDQLWKLTNESYRIDWSHPAVEQLLNDDLIAPINATIDVTGTDDDWHYFTLRNIGNEFPGLPHPIHLHGHDFAIIAQSNDSKFDPANPANWNLDNPPRRDVAVLPANGTLIIAFKTDNPGIWVMHCHIAWHASSGLALQIAERKDEIASLIEDTDSIEDRCKAWRSSKHGEQEDSGI